MPVSLPRLLFAADRPGPHRPVSPRPHSPEDTRFSQGLLQGSHLGTGGRPPWTRSGSAGPLFLSMGLPCRMHATVEWPLVSGGLATLPRRQCVHCPGGCGQAGLRLLLFPGTRCHRDPLRCVHCPHGGALGGRTGGLGPWREAGPPAWERGVARGVPPCVAASSQRASFGGAHVPVSEALLAHPALFLPFRALAPHAPTGGMSARGSGGYVVQASVLPWV